jgi:hypothetical protein
VTADADTDGRGRHSLPLAAVCVLLALSPVGLVVGTLFLDLPGHWGWVAAQLPLFVLCWMLGFVPGLRPVDRRARRYVRGAAFSVLLLTIGLPLMDMERFAPLPPFPRRASDSYGIPPNGPINGFSSPD